MCIYIYIYNLRCVGQGVLREGGTELHAPIIIIIIVAVVVVVFVIITTISIATIIIIIIINIGIAPQEHEAVDAQVGLLLDRS